MHNHHAQDFRTAPATVPTPEPSGPTQPSTHRSHRRTASLSDLLKAPSHWDHLLGYATTDERRCAVMGFKAAEYGLWVADNPHRHGSKRWLAWRTAWLWQVSRYRQIRACHDYALLIVDTDTGELDPQSLRRLHRRLSHPANHGNGTIERVVRWIEKLQE